MTTPVGSTPVPGAPGGWTVLHAHGPARFVTRALLERPDGARVEWSSRRQRKGLGFRALDAGPAGRRRAPSPSSVRMAAGFGLGSVCFALGSLPLFFGHVPASAVSWTFAVGSVFFTWAAALQYGETARAPEGILDPTHRPGRVATLLQWRPHRVDWWAAFVQLVGTACFNVSTFAATRSDLSLSADRHLVWAPDVYGSICFLVASWLAYAEVNRGVLPRPDRSVGWWIVGVNLAGSVAFGVSAVAARYVGDSAEPANIELVNLGTFVGAVAFGVGAVLLPVESARDAAPPGTDRAR